MSVSPVGGLAAVTMIEFAFPAVNVTPVAENVVLEDDTVYCLLFTVTVAPFAKAVEKVSTAV